MSIDYFRLYNTRSDLCEIEDHLFLTNQWGAKNKAKLQEKQITHILVCGSNLILFYPKDFKYMQIELFDNTNVEILEHFKSAFAFIDEGISSGGCLVHCAAGRSRSASFVIGYIMHKYKRPYEHVFKMVDDKRGCALNGGFIEQLKLFESNNYELS